MQSALEASGNRNFEVEELADLNLFFQTADIGIFREANWTEETISPVVLKRDCGLDFAAGCVTLTYRDSTIFTIPCTPAAYWRHSI
jgi:hypothetical protein